MKAPSPMESVASEDILCNYNLKVRAKHYCNYHHSKHTIKAILNYVCIKLVMTAIHRLSNSMKK